MVRLNTTPSAGEIREEREVEEARSVEGGVGGERASTPYRKVDTRMER